VKDPGNIPDSMVAPVEPGSDTRGLLEAVKQRRPEAWNRLAHLYGPLVFGWCRRAGLQTRDAEDVLQEVFLTVASRIADFQPDPNFGTFRGWLRMIARNKIGDWLRRHTRQEQAAGGSEARQALAEVPGADLPEEEGAASALSHRALRLIQEEFTESSWQAFWRVVVEEQAPADVAADLGLSRNAVYIARSRILRRLREALGEEASP
jgi:RNA polymerase sigma-70 factor (ECF subfamily)